MLRRTLRRRRPESRSSCEGSWVIDIAPLRTRGRKTSSREVGMGKLTFALALFASPALAQTPNLSAGPPLGGVADPVVCLPIGKTAKGDLAYSLDCRDLPPTTGLNNVQHQVLQSPASSTAVAPP